MPRSNLALNRPFPQQIEVTHSLPKHSVFSIKDITFALNRETLRHISQHHNCKVIRETLAYSGYPAIFLSKSMNLKKIIERRKLYNSLQKITTKIGNITKYEKNHSHHQQNFSRYEMLKSVVSLRNKLKGNLTISSNTVKQNMNLSGISFNREKGKSKFQPDRPCIPSTKSSGLSQNLLKKIFDPCKTLATELAAHLSPWRQQETAN